MEPAIVSFVGSSNSGKTTYLEKLITEMKLRGYKVGVIKHDAHSFEIDIPGKDSWRHAQAGADIVCISSPDKMALIKKVETDQKLKNLVKYFDGMDIIFTEGYKKQGIMKIEVFRQEVCCSPVCAADELLAMVTDAGIYDGLPQYGFDQIKEMAAFLENAVIRR